MNNKGFTLIELMVVIAIIGVLAGIAAPIIFDDDRRITTEPITIETGESKVIAGDTKSSLITCFEGKKVIIVDGQKYWIGNEPNTWDEMKSIPCE